ncbi:MAG TPA: cytochrome c-type biogenesis CcmF C-terminal domain-containing protein [Thermoleophilaceae bacterium]|jgi:cytochrome c-type biogenesis protein CcmF
MTADIGSACLVVALLTALYAAGAALGGAIGGQRELVTSARRAFYCVAGLVVLAVVLLQAAYVRTDLSFELVARNSSTDTPLFYRVTAMWSSQEGSLLLWALLLSIYSSAVLFVTRRRMRDIVPYATAVLAGITAFFLSLMMVFGANPFSTLSTAPAQGAGLEPLLRHPAMAIHPPMLYSGYVGFAIPFAFAIGALIVRRTDADWIRATRRFALIAWTFLTCGVLLGALWSFSELGWGGYWAWDPVENASLMPWLLGTAFLHSVMVQEKRGMLKIWNATLIVGAFVMALIGTFLVRSGILDSIHAFGASTLGIPFLIFIGVVLVVSVTLIFGRREELRSEARLDSLLSREAFFLLNNLVLVVMCLVVFWGTFFPLISEAITGDRRSLGPPFFNRVTVPLALVLVLLSGIGPMLTWRKASSGALRRSFQWPVVASIAALAAMFVLTPAEESVPSLLMFTFCALVVAVVVQELVRGTSARRTMTGEGPVAAFGSLVARNRRRYGGYLVHVGVAIAFLGVAASSAFLEQRDVRMVAGQTTKVGEYEITYRGPTGKILEDDSSTGAPITLGAVIDVRKGDETWTMRPQRNYYTANDGQGGAFGRFFMGESTSEVDLRWGVTRDLWTAVQPDLSVLMEPIRKANRQFADANEETQALIVAALADRYRRHAPPATFRFIDSPMVAWIWIGGALGLLGAAWALWPAAEARRRRAASLAAARLGRELSRA